MFKNIQALFLATILACLFDQGWTQGYSYSAYSNPYQNSFAFATPNLKQIFTTKLANAPAQVNQQIADQQLYNNYAQQQNVFANYPQQQYQQQTLPANYYSGQQTQTQNGGVFATGPQQFATGDSEQLRQQLAYLQLQQMQQQQLQYQQQQQQQLRNTNLFQQFQQTPFQQSATDNSAVSAFENQQQQQREEVRTQNLLGVVYSPSTKVSQVKFDSAKLKYDF